MQHINDKVPAARPCVPALPPVFASISASSCAGARSQALDKKGATHTWALKTNGARYRMFRLIQTGVNSNNHFYLSISGMELYGVLRDSVPDPLAAMQLDPEMAGVGRAAAASRSFARALLRFSNDS